MRQNHLPMRPFSWSVLTIAAPILAACSATGYSIKELAEEINSTLDRSTPRLLPGDTISVTFPYKTEWTHTTRVRADGVATFLIAGDIPVAGLTLAQLTEKLTPHYQGQTLNVDLEVPASLGGGGSGVSISPQAAFVIGEVHNPGPVDLTGRTRTLFEIIAAAGGHLKATANLSNTILVRRLASGELRSWRLDADIYDWGDVPAVYLQPRDIVFVPNTAIDDINIWIDQYIRQMLPIPFPVLPVQ